MLVLLKRRHPLLLHAWYRIRNTRFDCAIFHDGVDAFLDHFFAYAFLLFFISEVLSILMSFKLREKVEKVIWLFALLQEIDV